MLQALGLDRCRFFMSGAAPIRPETIKYFLGFDIIIHELYGMSETTGVQCVMFGDKPKVGCVGKTVPGAETKIDDMNDPGENGEICMRGRNIMMGYLNREDKTTEDVDDEGWVHSGDIGSIDSEGYVSITGNFIA